MKALLGLVPLLDGEITVLGESPVASRPRVGYVPQRHGFDEHTRIRGIDLVRLGLAGTLIALACGTTGWFVVLRAQVFAADALSHVAFVGAIAAVVVGVDPRVGLFVVTLGLAGALTGLGRRGEIDDVPIGITFAWVLGIGVLLIEILARSSHGTSGITTVNTLFGSIYALSAGASALAALIGLLAVLGVLALFRPLLLATLDAELAELRGVPVRRIGAAFLVVLAVVTAEATQAVGALLLLGLIAAPAGAAHQLTTRPLHGIRPVGRVRGDRHVGRTRAQLRHPIGPAEHGDHRDRRRHLPPRRTHEARSASVGLSRAALAAG